MHLLLLSLLALTALPASRTASFAGWGVGSTFAYDDAMDLGPGGKTQRHEVWTISRREDAGITMSETVAEGSDPPRTFSVSFPLTATVPFPDPQAGGGPSAISGAAVEIPVAWEDLTVPAGSYHCLHTHQDTVQLESNGKTDTWWAAELPVPVRQIGVSYGSGIPGNVSTTTRTLIKVVRKAG